MPTASPRIVSRGEWGANPLNTPAGTIATPAPELWLHHTGSSGLHGASGMRSIQAGALAGGYLDIEYNVIVDTDGQLYMARGAGRDSAATANHNATSQAVCAMGNFEHDAVPSKLLDGIASAVLWLHAQGAVREARVTGPHSQVYATACCGANLRAQIAEINRRCGAGDTGGGGTSPGGSDDVPKDKDVVDVLVKDDGAWKLQYDGGVQTIRGSFHGSYFTLAEKHRNDPNRRFLTITRRVDGSDKKGYTLTSIKGETYTFPS